MFTDLLCCPFLTMNMIIGWALAARGHLSSVPASRGSGASDTVENTIRRFPQSLGSFSLPWR